MKQLLILLFTFFSIALSAQQFDPTTADTVLYVQTSDGHYDIVVGQRIAVDTLLNFGNGNIQVAKIYRNVDGGTVVNVKQNRLTARLNALSQIEQQLNSYKEQLLKDSLSIAEDRKKFEQGGGSTDELFAAKLKELAGDWTLHIGDVKDALTILPDGTFTSAKSGEGTIKLEAQDKMLLVLSDNKLKLFEKSAGYWVGEDGKVILEKKK